MSKKQSRKGLTLTWTKEMRLGLLLLYNDFSFTADEKVTVFKQIFSVQLKASGSPEVTKGKLSAQYQESRKEILAKAWATLTDNLPEAESMRDALRAKIKTAAQTADLDELQVAPRPELHSSAQPAPRLTTSTSNLTASRKRKASTTSLSQVLTKLSVEPETQRKKKRLAQSVEVHHSTTSEALIPTTPASLTPTKPRSKSQLIEEWRQKNQAVTKVFHQQTYDGKGIWISEERMARTKPDPVYPRDDVAQPIADGLLYRFWNDQSQSPLLLSGFVAGQYRSTWLIAPPPPPTRDAPLWRAMFDHLNKEKRVSSPFVSASNNLMWALRNAMKHEQETKSSVRISIIDPNRLDRSNLFHARPFHEALKPVAAFTNGAWNYGGKYEILIYHKIPSSAVVKTISLKEISTLAAQLPAVADLLRLNEISVQKKDYDRKILPELRQQNVQLTPTVIKAIADIAKALGLTYGSQWQLVSGVISDICTGWGLIIVYQTRDEWAKKAEVFAQAMYRGFGSNVRLDQFYDMKFAFLDGVRWGVAIEPNPKFRADSVRRVMRRAKDVGLESLEAILTSELEAALLAVRQNAEMRTRAATALPATPKRPRAITASRNRRAMLTPASGRSVAADSEFEDVQDEADDEIVVNTRITDDDDDVDMDDCVLVGRGVRRPLRDAHESDYDIGSESDLDGYESDGSIYKLL